MKVNNNKNLLKKGEKMGKQLLRILLVVIILFGSINLSAGYFVQNEAIALKALSSSSVVVKQKKKSTVSKQQQKQKVFNKTYVALLQ